MELGFSIPGVEVLHEVGRGQFGVVYRARRGTRSCAVKVPRAWSDATDEARRAFRLEAVNLARVSHPGVPSVMEVGEVGRTPYIVMDFALGATLSEAIGRGPIAAQEVVTIGIDITSALSAIHERGLVHRDLKPANVVVNPESSAASLLDLGLALVVDGEPTHRSMGTPAFAAPEQLSELPMVVDHRADIYSLGWLLYAAATGEDVGPQQGETIGDRRWMLTERLRQHTAGVDSALGAVLLRALAENPDERWPSAEAMGEALRSLASEAADKRVRPGRVPANPLFGRGVEVSRIRGAWDRARRSSGVVVHISGDVGAGKSELCQTALAELDGAIVLRVSGTGGYAMPHAGLRLLFAAFAGALRPKLGAEGWAALVRRASPPRARSVLAQILPETLESLDADPQVPAAHQDQDAAAEAAADFFAGLIDSPTVICVDGLHELDDNSLQVLKHLAARCHSLPMLLVVTGDASGIGARRVSGFLQALHSDHTIELPLQPLNQRDAAELVAASVGAGVVPGQLAEAIASLSDYTPLGILERVRVVLENGLLTPYWGEWRLDLDGLRALDLPDRTSALLLRRLDTVSERTRRTLAAIAVLGDPVERDLLEYVVGGQIHSDILEAIQGAVLTHGDHQLRFEHRVFREALAARIATAERSDLFVRAATYLAGVDGAGPNQYRAARYWALAGSARHLPETAAANESAALMGFRALDLQVAMFHFGAADRARRLMGVAPSLEQLECWGDACVRLGEFEQGLDCYERALALETSPLERARLFSALAWAQHGRSANDHAWSAVVEAFTALGVTPPGASWRGWAAAGGALAGLAVRSRRVLAPGPRRDRATVLGELFYQSARLSIESNRPVPLLQSIIRAIVVARPLGVTPEHSRASSMYGFLLSMLGFRRAGRSQLDRAKEMADQIGDAGVLVYYMQSRSVVAAWVGDMQSAVDIARDCVTRMGRWLQLNEYCGNCMTIAVIEVLRGRNHHALDALELASRRLRASGRWVAYLEPIKQMTRTALIETGRAAEVPRYMDSMSHVRAHPDREPGDFDRLTTYPSRMGECIATEGLGAVFEQIRGQVDSEGYDPKRVHLVMTEYYIRVVQALINQVLAQPADQRFPLPPSWKKSVGDLRAAGRMPLVRAHAIVAAAYGEYFSGNKKEARALLAKADVLAQREACPWVLVGIARARAHMHRDDGLSQAASDQASIAAALAREHGMTDLYRRVAAEFDLVASNGPTYYSRSITRSRSAQLKRTLNALGTVSKATTSELDQEHQGRAVIDELVSVLNAERGILYQCAADGRPVQLVARDSEEAELSDSPPFAAAIAEQVAKTGELLLVAKSDTWATIVAGATDEDAARRIIAMPLFLMERLSGVIYLDRSLRFGAFTEEDAEILQALSAQVPVALELARSLRERKEIESNLQIAEKMRAVGQLAGGVAHDFNNVLTAIDAAVEYLVDGARPDEREEVLGEISDASRRAAALTRQLLGFSKRDRVDMQAMDVTHVLQDVTPMLRRVVGRPIVINLGLVADLGTVIGDVGQLEQVLMNLAVNARDAMPPEGGRIDIVTERVSLGSADAARCGLAPGEYALITVSDTGDGMPEEIRKRVFEPFFSTKGEQGTGLGLATAYGIVEQVGGTMLVRSQPGEGTTFEIYLPIAARDGGAVPFIGEVESSYGGGEHILLVEDEDIVRTPVARSLRELGYRVSVAENGRAALEILSGTESHFDLVVTDVLMPEMTGPQLEQQMRAKGVDTKLIYISGFTDGQLAKQGVLEEGTEILQKPLTAARLDARIRAAVRNEGHA